MGSSHKRIIDTQVTDAFNQSFGKNARLDFESYRLGYQGRTRKPPEEKNSFLLLKNFVRFCHSNNMPKIKYRGFL